MYSLPISKLSHTSLQLAGGKGANLGELINAGFSVPPGFCIVTNSYRAFVEHNQVLPEILRIYAGVDPVDPSSLESAANKIRSLFEKGEIPGEIASEISDRYIDLCAQFPELNPLPVAVRSSATSEDLPDFSFAGQQDTFLNVVGLESLLIHIVRCWSSLWTARAIGYRARAGIPPQEVSLAVIVQAMVPSEVSGVLFTANPLTGNRLESVIDASFGLGEAIVSGQVEPDHYVVDTVKNQILLKSLGEKSLSIQPDSSGGTLSIALEDGSSQQALTDAQILELSQIGKRASDHYGSPQDIEWGFARNSFSLLQSRPITTLYPLPVIHRPEDGSPNDQEDGPFLMFSFGAAQGMLDPLTPLGQDIFKILAAGFTSKILGYPVTIDTQETLYSAGERLFLNITGAVRHPEWRARILFFLTAIDPMVQRIVTSLLSDPHLAVTREKTPFNVRLNVLRLMLRIAGGVIYNLLWPEKGRARLANRIEKVIQEAQAEMDQAESFEERVALTETTLLQMPFRLLSYLLSAVVSGQAMLQPLLAKADAWPGGRNKVFEITRGLPHNVTTEMDLALWETAQRIRLDHDSLQLFQSCDPTVLAQMAKAQSLPDSAQRAVDSFLSRYGVRGLAEIDLGRPRWSEDPTPLLQVLCSYLKIDVPKMAPPAVFERGARQAETARNELISELRSQPGGWLKAHLAAFVTSRIRKLAGLRETPKFCAIRLMGIVRESLLREGSRLVKAGVIDESDDLFFLRFSELKHLAAGETPPAALNDTSFEWRELITSRRAAYRKEIQRRQVPRLLLGNGTAYYASMESGGQTKDLLTGSPVSPGVAEGTVRVILDPRGAQLLPGEILVCPATDPSWTPLFLAAAGLVMEMGGMMTHGSVVAREYGIPAVVGVPRLTERLHTGQTVRVNGSSGEITILRSE